MTARPTPERLAEIRARHDHAAILLVVAADKLDAGERRGVADVAELLAEVDALTAERDEARVILADLYAMATREPDPRFPGDQDFAVREAVIEHCRPKGES